MSLFPCGDRLKTKTLKCIQIKLSIGLGVKSTGKNTFEKKRKENVYFIAGYKANEPANWAKIRKQ